MVQEMLNISKLTTYMRQWEINLYVLWKRKKYFKILNKHKSSNKNINWNYCLRRETPFEKLFRAKHFWGSPILFPLFKNLFKTFGRKWFRMKFALVHLIEVTDSEKFPFMLFFILCLPFQLRIMFTSLFHFNLQCNYGIRIQEHMQFFVAQGGKFLCLQHSYLNIPKLIQNCGFKTILRSYKAMGICWAFIMISI